MKTTLTEQCSSATAANTNWFAQYVQHNNLRGLVQLSTSTEIPDTLDRTQFRIVNIRVLEKIDWCRRNS